MNLIAGFCTFLALAPDSAAIRLDGDPPKVASLTPKNDAEDVDPAMAELRIAFTEDMRRGSHSICGGGPTFPKLVAPPQWINERTLILKVKLEPDHTYEMSINCASFKGFQSDAGVPVAPVPWRFSTASSGEQPANQRKLNEKSFTQLFEILRDHYSYYAIRKIDWNVLQEKNREEIFAAQSTSQWLRRVAKMLGAAKDMHLWLKYRDITIPTCKRTYESNFDLHRVEATLGGLTELSKSARSAVSDDGIAYLLIPSWSVELRQEISTVEDFLAKHRNAKGMIIDVRPNGGGDESLSQIVASWFVEGTHVYSRNCYRDPDSKDGFGRVIDREIEGNPAKKRFAGPVAVLMGPANLSSCESFLLMMQQGKRVTLIGGKSGGSSGNPKPFTLDNGVELFVPSWKDMLPDGTLLEGSGVSPEIIVKTSPADFEHDDPVLKRALKHIREQIKD